MTLTPNGPGFMDQKKEITARSPEEVGSLGSRLGFAFFSSLLMSAHTYSEMQKVGTSI